jgi:hypothetical protein
MDLGLRCYLTPSYKFQKISVVILISSGSFFISTMQKLCGRITLLSELAAPLREADLLFLVSHGTPSRRFVSILKRIWPKRFFLRCWAKRRI